MDAFEVLMEEHGIILKAIGILEQSARKELPTDFYNKLLDIIRNLLIDATMARKRLPYFQW